jgi:UPF0755 protein
MGFLILFNFFRGPAKSAEKKRFVIPLETSEEKIVDSLKEKGFLKSKKIFNLILTFKGWRGKIQPGGYLIAGKMNAYELAQALVAGPYQKWALIPPGKRKEQVAVILQKALGWPDGMAQSFLLVAEEGYLFPDTYLINVDADPQEVVGKLRVNFNEKFDAQLQKDLLAQNVRNDTAIKVASLIERESGGEEDKPIIAGIIWNRLNKGMKLEIDATVQYAITTENLKTNPNIENFWSFLPGGLVRKINSPYNTYLRNGLPPGPICSPGLSAIKAAVYPAKTEAFYYLHSPDKQIHTAKTYKEHLENIKKYLE